MAFERRDSAIFAVRDARELYLDIFAPLDRASVPTPALLYLQGGGWALCDRGFHTGLATPLVEAGFLVVSADYRFAFSAECAPRTASPSSGVH